MVFYLLSATVALRFCARSLTCNMPRRLNVYVIKKSSSVRRKQIGLPVQSSGSSYIFNVCVKIELSPFCEDHTTGLRATVTDRNAILCDRTEALDMLLL